MNINDLKSSQDNISQVESLKQQLIDVVDQFEDCDTQIKTLVSNKKEMLSEQLKNDCKTYFVNKGFTITENGNFVTATYKALNIIFINEQDLTSTIIVDNIRYKIKYKNKFKEFLPGKLDGTTILINTMLIPTKEKINSINTIEKLNNMLADANGVVSRAKGIINNFGQLKWIFMSAQNSIENDNFADLFENL